MILRLLSHNKISLKKKNYTNIFYFLFSIKEEVNFTLNLYLKKTRIPNYFRMGNANIFFILFYFFFFKKNFFSIFIKKKYLDLFFKKKFEI